MGIRRTLITALLVLGLVVTGTASAAPRPTIPTWYVGRQYDARIEQQSGGGQQVNGGGEASVNGQRCSWDPDEWMNAQASGKMTAGTEVKFRWCFINDHDGQLVRATALTGNITVTLRLWDLNEPSRSWQWTGKNICAYTELQPFNGPGYAPYAEPYPYDWQLFAGTNGGIGRIWMAEITVNVLKTGSASAVMDLHVDGWVQYQEQYCGGKHYANTPNDWIIDSVERVWDSNGIVPGTDTGIDMRHIITR